MIGSIPKEIYPLHMIRIIYWMKKKRKKQLTGSFEPTFELSSNFSVFCIIGPKEGVKKRIMNYGDPDFISSWKNGKKKRNIFNRLSDALYEFIETLWGFKGFRRGIIWTVTLIVLFFVDIYYPRFFPDIIYATIAIFLSSDSWRIIGDVFAAFLIYLFIKDTFFVPILNEIQTTNRLLRALLEKIGKNE